MRRLASLLLGLACGLVACGDPSAEAPSAAPSPEAAPGFRIVTFNVWGVPIAVDLASRFERLPAALIEQDADVLCLQEVWTPAQREALATALAPRWTIAPAYGGGLLLAARHPLREATFTPFKATRGLSLAERIAGKGFLEAVIDLPGGPVRVVTTHLAHRGPTPEQFAELLQALADKRDLPLVVAGDFNLDPSDPDFEAASRLGLHHARPTGDDVTPTPAPPTRVGWPREAGATPKGWRPDHVLLRGLACVAQGLACDTPATALSDHNLVWVVVRRADP